MDAVGRYRLWIKKEHQTIRNYDEEIRPLLVRWGGGDR